MGVTAHGIPLHSPGQKLHFRYLLYLRDWRNLSNTGQCEVRKRNPNTIWRQELNELSLLGRRKFWLGQLVCLFMVCNHLLFLAVGCTGHSLLLRVSFMEKGAMRVKDKEE